MMLHLKHFVAAVIVAIVLIPLHSFAQVSGCTDSQANNYNSDADSNDGSCTYDLTLTKPKLKYVLPQEVEETSGLAFFNGGLWTLNDSGGEPVIYKLDTATGEVIQRIRLKNATNVDWEDMTLDGQYIFIGDFGNNSGNRKDLKVYKINRSDIPAEGDAEVVAEKIEFFYPDQPNKKIERRKYNNYDCEAMISFGDSLYLFSKNWENYRTRVYSLPKEPGSYAANLLDSYNVAGLITAADYDPQDQEIVLIGYTNKTWVPFAWLLFDFHDADFFSGNKRRIDMPYIMTTQTEGFTYVEGKHGVISSEKTKLGPQSAYEFNTGKWTGEEASVMIEKSSGSDFDFSISPNPVKSSKVRLKLENMPVGEYKIRLYDHSGRLLNIKKHVLKRKEDKVFIQLKTHKLAPGTYTIVLSNRNKKVAKNFIKE
jgi:hypothetical protein